MREFQQGETVELYAEVKTQAGVLVDPASGVDITIDDPSGVEKVSSTAMTNIDTGKYVYYYNIPVAAGSVGWWRAHAKSTDTGTKYTIKVGGFLCSVAH